MRRLPWFLVVTVSSLAAACGSSSGNPGKTPVPDSGSPPVVDAGVDAPAEAAPPEASPVPDTGPDAPFVDDSPQCGWTPFSDGLSGASIGDVLFDTRTQPPVVYATSGSTLYISGDSGHTWRAMGTFPGGGIGILAIPGSDPESLLASSTAGVIKSKDGGASWSVLALDGQATSSIAVAASETLRVYVGVRGSGVLRSDDAGVTWAAYTNQYPYVDTLAIDVAPDNPDEVVTGTVGLTTQDTYDVTGFVLRTTDGGHTWTTALMGAGNVWNVRRCAADAKTMYAATTQGVARSSDRGATWTVSSLGPMTSVEDVEVNPSDCNSVYAMASDGPHHSTDGAKTFGPPLQQGLNLVPYGTYPGRMAIDPKNANGVLVGSHGGIWYSTDGSTWNTALGILGVQVDGMSVSAADPGRLWLASWGSGVWQRPSSTQPWQRVPTTALPVDYAFTVAADPKQKDRVLVGATVLYTSTDATSFSGRGVSQNELSFAFDPSNASVLYAATQLNGVYKSTDGGMTWSPSNSGITPWSSSAGAMAIDVNRVVIDPASAQTLYAATNGRGVYKSTDGAQSWTMVLGPMQVIPCLLAVPGSMAASPAATKLYACIQGAGLQSSSDGGATWADASKGLPTLNVNGLATDAATGRVYATAGADVYVLDGTGTWSALDSVCMPGGGVSLPVVVATGSGRSLVVAGGGSVQAHAL